MSITPVDVGALCFFAYPAVLFVLTLREIFVVAVLAHPARNFWLLLNLGSCVLLSFVSTQWLAVAMSAFNPWYVVPVAKAHDAYYYGSIAFMTVMLLLYIPALLRKVLLRKSSSKK